MATSGTPSPSTPCSWWRPWTAKSAENLSTSNDFGSQTASSRRMVTRTPRASRAARQESSSRIVRPLVTRKNRAVAAFATVGRLRPESRPGLPLLRVQIHQHAPGIAHRVEVEVGGPVPLLRVLLRPPGVVGGLGPSEPPVRRGGREGGHGARKIPRRPRMQLADGDAPAPSRRGGDKARGPDGRQGATVRLHATLYTSPPILSGSTCESGGDAHAHRVDLPEPHCGSSRR
jgi:hypothetical protein